MDVITQLSPTTNDSPGVVQNVTATTSPHTNSTLWIALIVVGFVAIYFFTRTKKVV